jgi:hypothetical protein
MMKIYLMFSYIGWGWTAVVLALLAIVLKLKSDRRGAENAEADAEEQSV